MHVFHYSVLRFHPTDVSSLEIYVANTYVAMQKEVRKQEGGPDVELYVGGREKLRQMRQPEPPFQAKKNTMLNEFLSTVARLCASHYATIDLDKLNEKYGQSDGSLRVTEGPSIAIDDPELSFHLVSRGRKLRLQGKGVPTPLSPQPVQSWASKPEATRVTPASQRNGNFYAHGYLADIFEHFGRRDWELKDQIKSKEDLFQVRRLGDAVTSSTPASRQESATSQPGSRGSDTGRAAKSRRTGGD